jgi:two-component system, NtrC family, nitrogen regulation sensor histidine kinase GlnL
VSPFSCLDLLATAVVALDDGLVVRYANPAPENLFATGAKSLIGHPFLALFSERAELESALAAKGVVRAAELHGGRGVSL